MSDKKNVFETLNQSKFTIILKFISDKKCWTKKRDQFYAASFGSFSIAEFLGYELSSINDARLFGIGTYLEFRIREKKIKGGSGTSNK